VLAPLLGSALFFCVAPGVVAGVVPGALAGWRVGPPFLGLGALRAVGLALLAIGTAGLLDCFARFAIQGRGTPAPVAPTATLVVSGQYRYVRNPMYLAVVTVIVGQGLWFGSTRVLAYGGAFWCVSHLLVVGYEEPTLRRQFGGSYRAYQAGVRRWWPRARPWSPAIRPGDRLRP
jgi:protein-S-isoprenylcysteine O-methyltransferase Ste14